MRASKWSGAAAAMALALVALPAAAQTSETVPIYIGGTFGQSHWRPGCPSSAACSDTDRTVGVFAGYQFNRMFGAEVGFRNLGQISGSGATIKAIAWEAAVVASWPVTGGLSAYGRLGGYRGNAKGGGTLIPAKETNYSITYGLGAQLEITPNISLRGEWQAYPNIAGGTLGPRSDVNVMSVGAAWRFR